MVRITKGVFMTLSNFTLLNKVKAYCALHGLGLELFCHKTFNCTLQTIRDYSDPEKMKSKKPNISEKINHYIETIDKMLVETFNECAPS